MLLLAKTRKLRRNFPSALSISFGYTVTTNVRSVHHIYLFIYLFICSKNITYKCIDCHVQREQDNKAQITGT